MNFRNERVSYRHKTFIYCGCVINYIPVVNTGHKTKVEIFSDFFHAMNIR